MSKKPELLSPAGDLERLETAVNFGADAVYIGGGDFSLRANETSFSKEDLIKGLDFAHSHGKKIYLAMNIFPFDEDLKDMEEYLEGIKNIEIDGIIASDPGFISLIKEKFPKIKIHLSTQANTLNSKSVSFWKNFGVKRIVLGREVSLDKVKKIRGVNKDIELELFVHGAMCMSYSGRCFLSKGMTGRSGNQGECTQPCRWEYGLKEKNRPDEEFTLEEDSRGSYILNSKDLCMIEHIPELIDAGIDSFKIEGRMKSPYYVALTTKIYRESIDSYFKDPKNYRFDPLWLEELKKVSNRKYTTGFYFEDEETENKDFGSYIHKYNFVGTIKSHDTQKNEVEILGRNLFLASDNLEVLDPQKKEITRLKIIEMRDVKKGFIERAHNNYHVYAKIESVSKISENSILRREIPTS